jgi:DinB superfamily
MKKLGRFLALASVWCSAAFAQANNPVTASGLGNNRISTFIRKALAKSSEEITAAAAAMPDDKYNFKAPPDDITFGYLTLHIADGNYLFCSYIGGVSAPALPQLGETDPKQTLLNRLKSSFDFCTTALVKLDDSHMSEVLSIGDAKMSRAMAVLTLTGSWTTHYDLQQKYLQLNGYSLAMTK